MVISAPSCQKPPFSLFLAKQKLFIFLSSLRNEDKMDAAKQMELMRAENKAYVQCIVEARDYIQDAWKKKGAAKPSLAITLGSGLGELAEELQEMVSIPTKKIPHWPESTVEGHSGRLILASHNEHQVVLVAGRTHYYEYGGMPNNNPAQVMKMITFYVRVLKALGITSLFLSNAAGGLNTSWKPPTLMLCKSFIDKSGASPLMGMNIDELGPRFPPMGGDECNAHLSSLITKAAEECDVPLKEGTYAMVPGPRYEFGAECLSLRKEGADAVGMSTVPEVVAGLHGHENKEGMGRRLQVIAVTCITNAIGEDGKNATNHEEVVENGKKAASQFIPLVKKFIELYHA